MDKPVSVTWTYTNDVVHCVEYDKQWINGQLVDLGWDYHSTTVHKWVSALNKLAAKVYKELHVSVQDLRMHALTAQLLWIQVNDYYTEEKFGHYHLHLDEQVPLNQVAVLADGQVVGTINIDNIYEKV